MKENLSVVILVKNEEQRIARCLDSVKWADEIIVVDDESTDNTVEIARQYTSKVFTEKKKDIEGKHRNWSYSLAKNIWVLSLDADEVVTSELKEEIIQVINSNPVENGFTIPRKNYIGDYWVRYGGWYPSPQLKLFKKDKFKHEEVEIHGRAFMDGPCGHLKSDLIHYSYRNIEDLIRKLNNQTTWEAQKWYRLHKPMHLGRFFYRSVDRFVRTYFVRKGYKDGFMGFVAAFNGALYQIISYLKYREMVVKNNASNKKSKVAVIFIIVTLISLGAARIYNADRFHLEKQTRLMMNTYVTIHAIGPKKISTEAINLAFARMKEIEKKFSPYDPESQVSLFNRQNIPITDPEILKVARLALEVSKKSNGAFDITCFPLTALWGFNTRSYRVPSKQEIEEALKNVGYQHLKLSDVKLEKDKPEIVIDLGGIAKGYAVGQAVRVLKTKGITSGLVDAGGDIYALGKKGNKFWKIGVKDPFSKGLIGYLEVEDLAVMGSGNYERFFVKDGKKYHHIFNPVTGYPAEGLAGITVIYADPSLADAWATAFFVLGSQKGMDMVKIPGMKAVMVTDSGKILYSPSPQSVVEFSNI